MRINRKYNIEWMKRKRVDHNRYIKETEERVRKFAWYLDKETWRTTSNTEIKELTKLFIR